MKKKIKPGQILLSKRANVFYLEHVRVMQKDDRVVYLSFKETEVDSFYNIPERNTMFILLGKGCSITDSAIRKLADSNVIVGFVGNGGSPLLASVDYVFLSSQTEYRPTEYMQEWMKMWLDSEKRLVIAKQLQIQRLNWVTNSWSENSELKSKQIIVAKKNCIDYLQKIESAIDTQHLMAVEAGWAKNIYRLLAQGYKLEDFKREEGKQSRESIEDIANSFIDHGNYIAYGYAASALNILGISFALPVMHGKTRRGALVFDVADLYKDAIILPMAFYAAKNGWRDQEYRDALIEKCHQTQLLDTVINLLIDTIKNFG